MSEAPSLSVNWRGGGREGGERKEGRERERGREREGGREGEREGGREKEERYSAHVYVNATIMFILPTGQMYMFYKLGSQACTFQYTHVLYMYCTYTYFYITRYMFWPKSYTHVC